MIRTVLDPPVLAVALGLAVAAALLGVPWPYAVLAALATLAFRAALEFLPRSRPATVAVERSTAAPQGEPGRHAAARLSEREVQVAQLVAEGLTNRQIAERLVLSEKTIDTHVEHIKDKLDFHHRAEIAAWVAAHGLMRVPAQR